MQLDQSQLRFEGVRMTNRYLVALGLAFAIAISFAETNVNSRKGKIFSLFSVVQFKNSPCISTSTLSTGQSSNRNGTCYAQR